MNRQRTAFAIGIGALALTGLLHLAVVAAGMPEPANEAEATLFGLLASYEFPGVPLLTLGELLRGLSLSFAVLLLGAASLGLVELRGDPSPAGLRTQGVVLAGTTGILVGIGIRHFPLAPTLLLGLAFVAFVASIAAAGRADEGG